MKTRATELFGVKHPIVQTGMGWVSGAALTAATANAGGLGILAAAVMSYDELAVAITETKARTTNSFGVNLRADSPEVVQCIELMAREGVKVAEWGVDAVIVQGGEGGGHTGQVPTTVLLPQVVDAVDIPVIAAGGFFDGRGLVAALAYGAEGIAMGTRFLLTSDSLVGEDVKRVYLSKGVAETVVTTEVDGVPHRVLRTEFVEELLKSRAVGRMTRALKNAVAFQKLSGTPWKDVVSEGLAMRKSAELSLSQLVMAANTPMLLKAAMVDGRPDLGVMASGQVVGLIEDLPSCAELIERIMNEAETTLKRLA